MVFNLKYIIKNFKSLPEKQLNVEVLGYAHDKEDQ